jgi:hypothetical protein
MFTIIWNPRGFYVIDRFLNDFKMNREYFVTNILILLTCVYIIALLLLIAHTPKLLTSDRCANILSASKRKEKPNRTSSLKTMKNQNNGIVLHIIRPNCPGSSIGVKPKVLVTWSINVIRTSWLGNCFQRLNTQIFSDSTCPPRRSRRANIWYFPQTDWVSNFNKVQWSRRHQLR